MYRSIILSVLICALGFTAGCDNVHSFASRPVVIALIDAPSSSGSPEGGASLLRNAQFAVEYYDRNFKRFGPKRFSFVLAPLEMGEGTNAAQEAVTKALHTYNAHLIIGGMTPHQVDALAVAAEKNAIPFITPNAATSSLTEGKQFTFTTAPALSLQVEAAAHYMLHNLRLSRLGILYDRENEQSVEFANTLNITFRKLGGNKVAMQAFTQEEIFAKAVETLLASQPETIVCAAPVPSLLEQSEMFYRKGFRGPLFGADPQQILDQRQALANEPSTVYGVAPWVPSFHSEMNTGFIKDFRAGFDKEPTIEDALTFDAFIRLFSALDASRTITRRDIRTALAGVKTLTGVAGDYTFTETAVNTATIKTMWILELRDGEITVPRVLIPAIGGE